MKLKILLKTLWKYACIGITIAVGISFALDYPWFVAFWPFYVALMFWVYEIRKGNNL